MKLFCYIIGVLLFLSGSIFFLQGVGLYPVGGMAYQVASGLILGLLWLWSGSC